MINIKHKYGPFKKNKDYFYRVCLKCGKKTQYPLNEEIMNEFNNQRITDYVIDIIIGKNIDLILDEDYFLKLLSCLLDNISYIYLNNNKQDKLIKSLRELNSYYNNDDDERFTLIDDTVCYLNDYFENYNNEIKDIFDDDLLESLDDRYITLNNGYDIVINDIMLSEDSTTVEINSDINEEINDMNITLSEAENESD